MEEMLSVWLCAFRSNETALTPETAKIPAARICFLTGSTGNVAVVLKEVGMI